MEKKQKLELNWIGKNENKSLEARILIEDTELSYHANSRNTDKDTFDNKLIFGDNLLALKALEQEFIGKIKCVYIDPPFNTGSAFEHYDDGIEHSIWLDLMTKRLKIIRDLLADDGAIFIHLDDNEAAYLKVLMDEIFGRKNYVNHIIFSTNKPFGFKSTSDGLFKQANHLFFYAKDKTKLKINSDILFIEKGYDTAYKWEFYDTHLDEASWKWRQIDGVLAENLGYASAREARAKLGDEFDTQIALYAIENAERVFRTASVSGGALLKRKDTIKKSKELRAQIIRHPNDDMDYLFIGGERVIYYKERLKNIDGQMLPGDLITDIWTDIPIEGLAVEGGVDFPKGKKPEKLIQRVIELVTKKGDWILDSFAGSGTTAAVAHKLNRSWITIELGDHCHSHIIPRIKSVINGTDQTGISRNVDWKGGGGFRYYKLAPSLLEKDKWGQWVINKTYNPNMLASAICKQEGFTYNPNETEWWNHGYSTENDFIYVTTQIMTEDQLLALAEDIGSNRTLLICCSAFKVSPDLLNNKLSNLTLKKIPNAIMSKCEWGRDDYKLNIAKLPQTEPGELIEKVVASKKSKIDKTANLFDENN
jgi:adenine-specific DNA-methyltransferase